MSYFCYLLYDFLQYKQTAVCTLEELAALLAEDDGCPNSIRIFISDQATGNS